MSPPDKLLKEYLETAAERKNVCIVGRGDTLESQSPTREHGQTEDVANNQKS